MHPRHSCTTGGPAPVPAPKNAKTAATPPAVPSVPSAVSAKEHRTSAVAVREVRGACSPM